MDRVPNIMREYEELREKHKQELEYRKSTLYAKIPRLKEIEDEMVRVSIDITRGILNRTENKEILLERLHSKQTDLKVEKAEILITNKYPRDYLEMKYHCKTCKDTGFVDTNKCICFIQKEIDYLYKQSNMGHNFKKENFDQFRLDFYSDTKNQNGLSPRDNMKEIYLNCVRYTQDFDSHHTNLLFIGKPGLGKTFLCNCIAKELLDAKKSVIYQSSADLIDMIRKYKFDFDNENANIPLLDEIFKCDLLIVDDLGTELTTQFSGLVIYNILNRRILHNRKMIISTNLDIDEIMKIYSDRITSRMFGNFDIYEFFGEDIRLKMHGIMA